MAASRMNVLVWQRGSQGHPVGGNPSRAGAPRWFHDRFIATGHGDIAMVSCGCSAGPPPAERLPDSLVGRRQGAVRTREAWSRRWSSQCRRTPAHPRSA